MSVNQWQLMADYKMKTSLKPRRRGARAEAGDEATAKVLVLRQERGAQDLDRPSSRRIARAPNGRRRVVAASSVEIDAHDIAAASCCTRRWHHLER